MNCIESFRVSQLELIQDEAKELFRKKNQDYGDAFADYGTVGVLVRMGDKIRRYQSITNKGINLVEDEKLRDTLIDLHNYAAMGIMLIDEKKFNSQYETNEDDKYQQKQENQEPQNLYLNMEQEDMIKLLEKQEQQQHNEDEDNEFK